MLETVRVIAQRGLVRVELARWEGRLVVVKRLLGVADEVSKRHAREAEVVRKLDHPNIVPLLAAGERGELIYAYIPGGTLADVLEGGHLPPARAARVAADVLAALAHAHHHGVLHQDVKPENILLQGDRALLSDFGFAKDLSLTAITGDQELLGTPNYMAPEQFQGVRTDQRSDVYAVGAVLYHALVGEPPYGGQVLRFLVGDDRVVRAPLPASAAGLAEVVERALLRDAEGRFPDALSMLAALQQAEL